MVGFFKNASYYHFSLVREPHKRFLSAYHEISIRQNATQKLATNRGSQMTYLKFTKRIPRLRAFLRYVNANGFFNQHIVPASHVLSTVEGSPLPIDYIGRTENLSADMRYVMGRTGYRGAAYYPLQFPVKRDRPMEKWGNEQFMVGWDELREDDWLSICKMYIEDYCCLHLKLPPGCESLGKDLNSLCDQMTVSHAPFTEDEIRLYSDDNRTL